MFKRVLIVGSILAMSSSMAFAMSYKGEKDYKGEMAAPCPVSSFVAGPYIGLSVGSRTNYSGTPVVFKGIDGNLSLGYAAMINPAFYLAGELFGLGTLNVKDLENPVNPGTSSTAMNSAKSSWGYGVSIIPGYMINDTVLAYLRAGAIRTRFNGQGVNKTGWQLGLGGETAVAPNWDVRVEWIYSYYGSVSGIGKTSAEQANLGLVYKFV